MFKNLLSRLLGDAAAESRPSADDADMAIAALLVRIARADDRYQDVERARIMALLSRRRGLSAAEAADHLAAAELLEAEAPDTVRFTRAVKERVPLDQRRAVIEAMWDVALADGHRSADEDAAVRLAAKLLGVNDVDSAHARQAVGRAMRAAN